MNGDSLDLEYQDWHAEERFNEVGLTTIVRTAENAEGEGAVALFVGGGRGYPSLLPRLRVQPA